MLGISVGTPDIGAFINSRGEAGPFIIMDRIGGRAFDSGSNTRQPRPLTLELVNGEPRQLWVIRKTKFKNEYEIVSNYSGHAIDSQRADCNYTEVVLYEPNSEPWQRWFINPCSDRIAWTITSVHAQGKSLDVGASVLSEGPWAWTWDHHGSIEQQFLIFPASENGYKPRSKGSWRR